MSDNPRRVLAVDDNRVNRLKLVRALNAGDFDVVEASGGRQALELLRGGSFDLVLLDVLMPEVDGFEVLRQMRVDPRLSDIPVIMVSAVDEEADVQRCLAMGASDYITKPFDAAMLNERVSAAWKKRDA